MNPVDPTSPRAEAWARFDSPLGPLGAVATARGLAVLAFAPWQPPPGVPQAPSHPWLQRAAAELDRFWHDPRAPFTLALDAAGTPFQRAVWHALTTIEPGGTRSYAEIARQVGRPKAVRAVGAANGANPIAIVVPCHRVIGANGTLTGYAGGLERKAWLLRHESAQRALAA